jgi:purine-nucleoside phosphorylase
MSEYPASNSQLHSALAAATQYIQTHLGRAEISVVLGSGLGQFSDRLTNASFLAYKDIPFMPTTSVKSHAGKLFIGEVSGKRVYCWSGRIHAYDGYENYQTGIIAHLSAHLGCHTILITNASGGAIPGMIPGCVMLINDFVNLHGRNPLDTYYHCAYTEKHFVPAFKTDLLETFRSVHADINLVPFYEGTYMWATGPSYETPYEISCYGKVGGSLYGMSTVPEVIAAASHGMNFVVVSVITNLAAGITGAPMSHTEVYEAAAKAGPAMEEYFIKLIEQLPEHQVSLPTWSSLHVPTVPIRRLVSSR